MSKNDQNFFTVQDNSASYQEFQEVTGIRRKIKNLGKSFKIFYTGFSVIIFVSRIFITFFNLRTTYQVPVLNRDTLILGGAFL